MSEVFTYQYNLWKSVDGLSCFHEEQNLCCFHDLIVVVDFDINLNVYVKVVETVHAETNPRSHLFFLCLPACLRACLLACLHACLPVCLSVCLPACPSACLSVCLLVSLALSLTVV